MTDPAARLRDALAATGSGVAAWSVYASSWMRLSLGVKDRRIGTPHVPKSLAKGCSASYLVVWDDGRLSRGSFERRQLEDPAAAMRQARAATYDDPDAAHVLGPQAIPDVPLWHESTADTAAGRTSLLDDRLATIERVLDDPRIRTWSGSLAAGASEVRLVTSAGLDAAGRGTSIGWHVSVNGAVGDGFAARVAEDDEAFAGRLDRLMRLVDGLSTDAPAIAGGELPVLLHPSVVESFVLGTLLDNLGGSSVAHGESHFRRESFGADRAVLRPDLTLRLDPFEPLAAGSYRFTSEGVPAARIRYVDRGRLVTPMLDLKYARRLGLAPTPLPYGMSSLRLEGPPTLEADDAIAGADGGVMILSVLGVHTQDSSSGDFSLSAPHALHLGPDGAAGHARGTISGNLFAALEQDTLRLVRFEGETTPGVLIRCRFDPA